MLPPDPYHQSDQSDQPDAVEQTDDYPTPPSPGGRARASQLYYTPPDNSPLPLPYDDRDPTYQSMPTPPPPALPVPNQQRPARMQPYVQPPIYHPPAQPPPVQQPPAQPPQVIYVRERRPSVFSITCSILTILLLMTCGLVGLGIFRGATSAVELASKTIPSRFTLTFFCMAEMNKDYHNAYQQLSSGFQQLVSETTFTQESRQLDQQNGPVTACARSNSSVDTGSGNTAMLQVDVTRTSTDSTGASSSTDYHGSIIFVQEGGNWHIDQIAGTLGLPTS
jgi:hypothetical protein